VLVDVMSYIILRILCNFLTMHAPADDKGDDSKVSFY
jgi:hypothetical protein